jgi:hypothetical protein
MRIRRVQRSAAQPRGTSKGDRGTAPDYCGAAEEGIPGGPGLDHLESNGEGSEPALPLGL